MRSRTFGQLTLARVLVDARRIDEAAAVGLGVCQVALSLTSHRVLAQLDRLGAALGPYQQVSEVGNFIAALPLVRRDSTRGGPTWPV